MSNQAEAESLSPAGPQRSGGGAKRLDWLWSGGYQHFKPQTDPQKLQECQDFQQYWERQEEPFADIEFFEDAEEAMEGLVEPLLGLRLEGVEFFAKTGSGSLLGVWTPSDGKPLFVYFDSGFEPISVLCEDSRSFLSLLLCDVGLLYDVLYDLEAAKADSRFRGEELQAHFQMLNEENEGRPDFVRWCAERGVEEHADPVGLMATAIESNPSFSAWLGQLGVEGLG